METIKGGEGHEDLKSGILITAERKRSISDLYSYNKWSHVIGKRNICSRKTQNKKEKKSLIYGREPSDRKKKAHRL